MSTKAKSNGSKISKHDGAAAIISTAITMQNDASLPIQMRNIPGRGFVIVIQDWYFDGQTLSRQPPQKVVANQAQTVPAE